MNGIGERRPDIGPAIVGYRERKIAKLQLFLNVWSDSLKAKYTAQNLASWELFNKEIEIQKCYLQHENIGAI